MYENAEARIPQRGERRTSGFPRFVEEPDEVPTFADDDEEFENANELDLPDDLIMGGTPTPRESNIFEECLDFDGQQQGALK